jgi:hypothetical protein
MDQAIIYQLKLAALQAANGDVTTAESLFQWLTKEAQEADAAAIADKQGRTARIQQIQEQATPTGDALAE